MLDLELERAGFTPETLVQIDQLVVGCGGFVEELIRHTGGASTVKDAHGQRLSAADEWIDQLLRDNLTRLVPGSSGYSEESGEFGRFEDGLHVRWMLDPVDGTRPALLGGAFAVSAGAVILQDRRAVAALGWIYVPTLSTLYRGFLSPDRTEALRNGVFTSVEQGISWDDLRNRYFVVNSDWTVDQVPGSPLKLSAPGATAVHLTQLVHPESDVSIVLLSRYRPYDAAAGLIIAAAGGAVLQLPPGADPASPTDTDALDVLTGWCGHEGELAQRLLVASPEVLALLA